MACPWPFGLPWRQQGPAGSWLCNQPCYLCPNSGAFLLPPPRFWAQSSFSFPFFQQKVVCWCWESKTRIFYELQVLKNLQLSNATILCFAYETQITRNFHAPELRSVDFAFNPWLTLLISLSRLNLLFGIWEGKNRRNNPLLFGDKPTDAVGGFRRTKYPLGCSWDVMQTPSPPAPRSLATLHIHPAWLSTLSKWGK